MVANDIKEIKRDRLLTIPKLAGGKLSKPREKVLHTAYESVIYYSVSAKI